MNRRLHTNDPADDMLAAESMTDALARPAGLTVSSVSVTYRHRNATIAALADVSVRVSVGETVAVLGPAGAGLSTLIAAVAGTASAVGGRIVIGDRDVTTAAPVLRPVGTVAATDPLFERRTVADNVAAGVRPTRRRSASITTAVRRSLAQLRIADLASCRADEVSPAQRRRVLIARALVESPQVLLLDEPFAGLAAADRAELVRDVDRLRHTTPTLAVLCATHDRHDALALADRVTILDAGRIVAVDTPAQLWDRPPNAFTATLLGDANLVACTVERVMGGSALVSVGARLLSATAPRRDGVPRLPPRSSARLCVRPHEIEVCATDDVGALPALVTETSWRGPITRLSLDVDGFGGQLIVADVAGRVRYRPQAAVGVLLPPRSCVLLPPE